MNALQGMIASDTTPFDIKDFIASFRELHDQHCRTVGKKIKHGISVELQKATDKQPLPHYKITTGAYFTGDLIDFFRKQGLRVANGIGNEIFVYKKELESASLTKQHATVFLSELKEAIEQIESRYFEAPAEPLHQGAT